MWSVGRSSPVTVSLEVEPQLEDVVLELAAETPLIGVLPFSVDNLEGYVLQYKVVDQTHIQT